MPNVQASSASARLRRADSRPAGPTQEHLRPVRGFHEPGDDDQGSILVDLERLVALGHVTPVLDAEGVTRYEAVS